MALHPLSVISPHLPYKVFNTIRTEVRGCGSGKLALEAFEARYDPFTGGWYPYAPLVSAGDPWLPYEAVEREVGHLYTAFVKILQPRAVLETGCARGYSTTCIAYGLQKLGMGGHIWTIDPRTPPHLFANTDLESYVTFIPKRSQDAYEDLRHLAFDLLVIDSDHHYDTCFWEVCHFSQLLKPNGVILMHDSIFFDGVGHVVRQLAANPRFEVITLPTPRTEGNPGSKRPGLSIVRKICDGSPPLEFDSQYVDPYGEDDPKHFLLRQE